MTAQRQWQIVLGMIVVLAVDVWAATRALGDELFPVAIGSRAPGFSAAVVQATTRPRVGENRTLRSLADYRGQVVLVNIWETSCEPCRQEIPSLQALYREFAPRGFKIVAVSTDEGADAPARVAAFVRSFGVTFDVLHDPNGTIQQRYQTTGVPENFVLGADGVIRKKAYAQDWSAPENRALIGRLLEESGAPASPAAPATAVPRDASPARPSEAR